MESVARIGPSIHIKGEVASGEPLAIAGHVDGTIAVDGHRLTVDPGSRIEATVTAHTIIISGTVSGKLNAGSRIEVRETATVRGDMTAPVVCLAEGATVHGRVETSKRKADAKSAA
jgi:cytoskeletal protein CcmA (bactofilin family)